MELRVIETEQLTGCIRPAPVAFSAVRTKQGDHTRRFIRVHLDRTVVHLLAEPNRYVGHSNSLQSGEPSLLFAHLVAALLVPRQKACSRDSYPRSEATSNLETHDKSCIRRRPPFDCPYAKSCAS